MQAGVDTLLVTSFVFSSAFVRAAEAQEPAGLAASALADSSFSWIPRRINGFRVYFAAGSYPAAHQDSLLKRLPRALSHVRALINAPALRAPLDVFFVESRAQMTTLIGARATGFAEPFTRSVFLMTNPEWRAFERHEIMHVVAQHAWGPPAPGTDWLSEGLAQAADGRCAGHSNADILLSLTTRHGWIPLDTMLTKFRAQPDLRAYLQAATFVDFLLRRHGRRAVREMWRNGARPDSVIGAHTLRVIERAWKGQLRARRRVTAKTLAAVESKGCG